MRAVLPLELEERIIDELAIHPAHLRNTSLVCTAWLTRSRFHLFRTIHVRRGTQVALLSAFLTRNPTLSSRIRKVVLTPTIVPQIALIGLAPVTLLPLLPHLECWELKLAHHQTSIVDAATVGYPPRLSYLSFSSVALACFRQYTSLHELCLGPVRLESRAELARLLASFGSLRSLRCTDITFKRTTAAIPLAFANARLARRRLRVSTLIVNKIDSLTLEMFLEATRSTLEYLSLDSHTDSLHSDHKLDRIVPTLMAIRTLSLKYTYNTREALQACLEHAATAVDSSSAVTFKHLRLDLDYSQNIYRLRQDLQHTKVHAYGENLENHLVQKRIELACTLIGAKSNKRSYWTRAVARHFPRLHELGLLVVCFRTTDGETCADGHEGSVTSLAVSPDSRVLATGGDDGTIILWDLSTHAVIREWRYADGPAHALAFSPDSLRLLSSDAPNDRAHIWPVHYDEHDLTPVLGGDPDGVSAWSWSPDGTALASISPTGKVRVWDAATRKQRRVFDRQHLHAHQAQRKSSPSILAFTPDGHWLVTCGPLREWCMWDMWHSTHRVLVGAPARTAETSATTFRFTSLTIAWGALTSAHGTLSVYKLDVATEPPLLSFHEKPLPGERDAPYRPLTFSPDGSQLAALPSEGSKANVVDSKTGRLRRVLVPSALSQWDRVFTACFSPHGRLLACGYEDGSVRVWRPSDGVEVATFTEHNAAVEHVAFSPDGRTLLSGGRDGRVCIRPLAHVLSA